MKINELFKYENIGKKVIDSCGSIWTIGQSNLELAKDTFITEFRSLRQILSLEFEFLEEKTGWEHVKEGDKVYFIDRADNFIEVRAWGGSEEKSLFENYNYFNTKEKAQEVANLQLELRKTLKCLDTEGNKNKSETIKKDLLEIFKDLRSKKSILSKGYEAAYKNSEEN